MGTNSLSHKENCSHCIDQAPADYSRLMAKIATFGEGGAQLMIKYGWLEQPPQVTDRKELALNR